MSLNGPTRDYIKDVLELSRLLPTHRDYFEAQGGTCDDPTCHHVAATGTGNGILFQEISPCLQNAMYTKLFQKIAAYSLELQIDISEQYGENVELLAIQLFLIERAKNSVE